MNGPPLQSLIVTQGWTVLYHQFFDIQPSQELVEGDSLLFREDLFQAANARAHRIIDLGWYPEGDFTSGHFRVVVHAGDSRGPLLTEFSSKEKDAIVGKMNEWMNMVSQGRL